MPRGGVCPRRAAIAHEASSRPQDAQAPTSKEERARDRSSFGLVASPSPRCPFWFLRTIFSRHHLLAPRPSEPAGWGARSASRISPDPIASGGAALFAVLWRGVSEPPRRDMIAPRLAWERGALRLAIPGLSTSRQGPPRGVLRFGTPHGLLGLDLGRSEGPIPRACAASRFGMPPRGIPHRRSRRPWGRFSLWAFVFGRGLIVRMRAE